MTCDLEALFGQRSRTLPTRTDGHDTVVFSSETLPLAKYRLRTDRIIIKKGFREYWPSDRVDALWFQADKLAFRQLGLLIFATVFQQAPNQVHLELTHPSCDVKHLLIDYPYRDNNPDVGFVTRLYGAEYAPRLMERYPWVQAPPVDPASLPVFRLTNQAQSTIADEQWQARDTVVGFGLEEASVRLAELFLNMGLPQNSVTEYRLEGEGGHRGIGIHSAEVRFCLPGSAGWETLL
jgi:hypothetical protein